jgi:hypothetical protein
MDVKLSLTHWVEKHMLSVFVNRVLRKIFGPKREDVTGCWRRLYNDEVHDTYSSYIREIKSKRT